MNKLGTYKATYMYSKVLSEVLYIDCPVNIVYVCFQNYFHDYWNIFDFITVLGSITDVLVTEFQVSSPSTIQTHTTKPHILSGKASCGSSVVGSSMACV